MKNNKDIFLVILIFLNVIILYLLISSKNKDPYVRTFKAENIATGKKETFENFSFKCKVFDTDDQYHIHGARIPGFKELKVKDIIPSGVLEISVRKPKKEKSVQTVSNLFNIKGAFITLNAHKYQTSPIWGNKFYGYSTSEEKYEANKRGEKPKNIPSYAFSGSLLPWKTHQPRPDIEKVDPKTYKRSDERSPQKYDNIENGFYSLNRNAVQYRSEIYLQPVDTYKSTDYDKPSTSPKFDKEQYEDAYYQKRVFIDISPPGFTLTMSMAEGITYNYYKSPKNKSDVFIDFQFTIRGNCERIPVGKKFRRIQ